MDAIGPVNGVNLFVRRFGDPASPMLVVIHGGPPWDHSYLLPVAELADIAHVVLFDLRGSGRLRLIPEAAHMAQFDNPAAWLAAVREFLKG